MTVFELLTKYSVMLIVKLENAYMARRTFFKLTWRVSKSTGTEWSLILKYAAALLNAAWADAGTTLWAINQHFQRICEMIGPMHTFQALKFPSQSVPSHDAS